MTRSTCSLSWFPFPKAWLRWRGYGSLWLASSPFAWLWNSVFRGVLPIWQ
jgi:hypothetical protein